MPGACPFALALFALAALPTFAQEPTFGLTLTKGGKHLFAINAVLGAGMASVSLLDTFSVGPNRNAGVGAAEAAGLLALFFGGGLTAGHLLDPTPPMAWSSFFAGIAGGALGLGIMTNFTQRGSFEAVLLASILGYVLGTGLDLALPGRDTMSWKEFWVPMAVAVIPGGALLFALVSMFSRPPELIALTMVYPVAAFLLTRAILSAVSPFDPWVDDLKPPFRAEPIIGLTPSGAMVGIAANW